MMCSYTLFIYLSLLTGLAQSTSQDLINRTSPSSISTFISSRDAQVQDLREATQRSRPDPSGKLIRRATGRSTKKSPAAPGKNPISKQEQGGRKSKSQTPLASTRQPSSRPIIQTRLKRPSSSSTRPQTPSPGKQSAVVRGSDKRSGSPSRSSLKEAPKASKEEIQAIQNRLNSLSLKTRSKKPQNPQTGDRPGGKPGGKLPPGQKQPGEFVWAAGQVVGPARVTIGNAAGRAGRDISPSSFWTSGVAHRDKAHIEATTDRGGSARLFAHGREVRLDVEPHDAHGQAYLATANNGHVDVAIPPPGEPVVSWSQGERPGSHVLGMVGLHGKGTISATATSGDYYGDRYRDQ